MHAIIFKYSHFKIIITKGEGVIIMNVKSISIFLISLLFVLSVPCIFAENVDVENCNSDIAVPNEISVVDLNVENVTVDDLDSDNATVDENVICDSQMDHVNITDSSASAMNINDILSGNFFKMDIVSTNLSDNTINFKLHVTNIFGNAMAQYEVVCDAASIHDIVISKTDDEGFVEFTLFFDTNEPACAYFFTCNKVVSIGKFGDIKFPICKKDSIVGNPNYRYDSYDSAAHGAHGEDDNDDKKH